MKRFIIIPLMLFSLAGVAACSDDGISAPETEQPSVPEGPDDSENTDNPDTPSGDSRMLVAYFSAQGHTQAVAECIVELTGADVYRIEAAEPYAANPYDDSDRIQNEAYNDLRPGAANLPAAETIAKYDTIFVGSP